MKNNSHKRRLNVIFALLVMIFGLFSPSFVLAGMIDLEVQPYRQGSKCVLQQSTGYFQTNKWWEKPVEAVTNAAVSVGEGTFNTVAGGAVKVMVVGFGLWLAVFTLKIVGGLQESDPMENLTKIGGMMLKTGIAAVLLRDSGFFFGYFVAPITSAGAGFAGLGGSSGGGSGLSAVVEPLKEVVESMHIATAKTQGLGDFAQCISAIYQPSIFGWKPFGGEEGGIIDPGVWSSGCAVQFGAFLLMLFFPILIFDALLRVGITAALCPLFIVAWVFPATADFAKKGLNSFLNVAFFFLCLKISMDMALKLLESAGGLEYLTDDAGGKTKTVCLLKWGGGDGLEHCAQYANDTSSKTGLFVFACCILYGFLLLKQATTFASYFSEANFSNDNAFQAAHGAAKGAQSAVGHAAQGAAMVSDKISQGKDRKAARAVQGMRQNAEKAKASGGTYTPTKKEMKAEQRLKNRGVLNSDGSETKDFHNLLKNGKRRWAMNKLTGGKMFKDGANAYGHDHERSADEVQNLRSAYSFEAPSDAGSKKDVKKAVRQSQMSNSAASKSMKETVQADGSTLRSVDKTQYRNHRAAELMEGKMLKDPANYKKSAEGQYNQMEANLYKARADMQRKMKIPGYQGSDQQKKDTAALKQQEKDMRKFEKANGITNDQKLSTKMKSEVASYDMTRRNNDAAAERKVLQKEIRKDERREKRREFVNKINPFKKI